MPEKSNMTICKERKLECLIEMKNQIEAQERELEGRDDEVARTKRCALFHFIAYLEEEIRFVSWALKLEKKLEVANG